MRNYEDHKRHKDPRKWIRWVERLDMELGTWGLTANDFSSVELKEMFHRGVSPAEAARRLVEEAQGE